MGAFFDIKQKFTAKLVEVGERFSYCINIKNISDNIIFDLSYREKFNDKIKIVSINIDGKEIKYKTDKNMVSFEIDKINVQETKSIFITIDVLDYIVKNEFNSLGKIEGKVRVNDFIQEVQEEIKHVELNIIYPKLVLTMISTLNEAVKDNIIEIIIIAENMGNINIQNVSVRDILKDGLRFIEKSVEIDREIDNEADPNKGIDIGELKVGKLKIIKFKAKVVSTNNEKIIVNKAIARYTYNNMSEEVNKRGTAVSNIEKISIQVENVEVSIEVDKEDISLNSEVLYKIIISNTGTLDLYNLFLRKDSINGFELIKNTMTLNGVLIPAENFENGVFLGDLKKCNDLELVFKLKYIGGVEKNFIENIFILEKDYQLKDKYIFKGRNIRKSIKHFINISSFNQVILDGEIVLGGNNPPIKEVNNLNCDIDIKEHYCIDTVYGQSVDNQINTGKKVILNGVIKPSLEYIGKNQEGSVHFVNDEHIFSTYVILPEYYKEKYNLAITGKIEDSSYILESEDRIKIIISVLIIVKIILD